MVKRETKLSLITFLFSTSTLLCCTIPALLSFIAGVGAVMSLMSAFPWMAKIGLYSGYIFTIAAIMLLINGYFIYRPNRVCPTDAKEYCEPVSKFAKGIFWTSVIIYIIGFTFAFILPYVLYGI